MPNRKRKQLQKKMNRQFKTWNKTLSEDPLWRGRFQVGQLKSYYSPFEDGSGAILTVKAVVYDKKTHKIRVFYVNNYEYTHWLAFKEINDFIVKDVKIWDNIDEVKNDKTVWDKVIYRPQGKNIYWWSKEC